MALRISERTNPIDVRQPNDTLVDQMVSVPPLPYLGEPSRRCFVGNELERNSQLGKSKERRFWSVISHVGVMKPQGRLSKRRQRGVSVASLIPGGTSF
jgi:hypothetical protein